MWFGLYTHYVILKLHSVSLCISSSVSMFLSKTQEISSSLLQFMLHYYLWSPDWTINHVKVLVLMSYHLLHTIRSSPLPPPHHSQPLLASVCSSCWINYFGTHAYMYFCVWLISLKIVSLRPVHLASCSTSRFPLAERKLGVCTTFSSASETQACAFLDSVRNAAITECMCV